MIGSRGIPPIAVALAALVASCGSSPGNTSANPDSPYPDYSVTYLQGPPDQAHMEAKPLATGGHRFWMLPATPQTTQWGVYDNGVNISYDEARVSAGFEFRVFLPVFQAPIRLIYGWPLREFEQDRSSSFQFSIGLPF